MSTKQTSDPFDARHFVQFYDSDEFLLDSVSGFLGAGLGSGEGAVVIAREDYRERLERKLAKLGFDVAGARAHDQYVAVDAATTLRGFMDEGYPRQDLFDEVIRRLVGRAARNRRRVRCFGEMVALLWEAGNLPAAIRLEQFWETLTREGRVSLFCAYPVANIHGRVLDAALTEICRHHSSVLPGNDDSGAEHEDERAAILRERRASSGRSASGAVRANGLANGYDG